MTLNFNQLDSANKSFYIVEGLYPIEHDKNTSWMWTSTNVVGIVFNIQSIIIHATSDIDNVLIYDNINVDIKPNSLNIIKLNTTDKTEFQFSLKNIFRPQNDTRDLGIQIKCIIIDGERVY
jgi:hypothetical protein